METNRVLRRIADRCYGRFVAALAVGSIGFSGSVQSADSLAEQCRLKVEKTATQGSLIVGSVDPNCQINHAGRALRVSKDGLFAIGFGRDAAATQSLSLRKAGVEGHQPIAIEIQQREYAIERVDGVPPNTVNPDPKLQARIDREQAEVVAARTRNDDRTDFAMGFVMPAKGRISGVYGSQRILNGTPKNPHFGLDIAAKTGSPATAPAAGVITYAKSDLVLTGGTLVIDHGHGVSSTFIHMSRIDVKVGDRVKQGQGVGAVGMTGRASGPHLHWAMNWFGERIDPQLALKLSAALKPSAAN